MFNNEQFLPPIREEDTDLKAFALPAQTSFLCLTPKHLPLNFSLSSSTPMTPTTPSSAAQQSPPLSSGLLSNVKYDFLLEHHAKLHSGGTLLDDIEVSPEKPMGQQELRQMLARIVQLPTPDFLKFFCDRKCNTFILEQFPRISHMRHDLIERMIVDDLILPLSKDPHGNYIVQAIIDEAGEFRDMISDILISDIVTLTCNRYACRVVQKALDKFPLENVFHMVQQYAGREAEVTMNINGSHVVQRIVQRFHPEVLAIFARAFAKHDVLNTVARHKFGCRIVQHLLDRLSKFAFPAELTVDKNSLAYRLLEELSVPILANAQQYVSDEFANYIITHIVTSKRLTHLRDRVIKKCLYGNLLSLSQEKFASHVVEQTLRAASPKLLDIMCDEIFYCYEPDVHGREAIDILLFDQFGNYVAQTLLRVCTDVVKGLRKGNSEYFFLMRSKILASEQRLMKYSSGKNILDMIAPLRNISRPR